MNDNAHINVQKGLPRLKLTLAEKLMWQRLNKRQVLNLAFKQFHDPNGERVDFHCSRVRLVVKINGNINYMSRSAKYKFELSAVPDKTGNTTIHYTNYQVLNQLAEVVNKIEREAKKCLSFIDKQ